MTDRVRLASKSGPAGLMQLDLIDHVIGAGEP
jgi:hypothetical protein